MFVELILIALLVWLMWKKPKSVEDYTAPFRLGAMRVPFMSEWPLVAWYESKDGFIWTRSDSDEILDETNTLKYDDSTNTIKTVPYQNITVSDNGTVVEFNFHKYTMPQYTSAYLDDDGLLTIDEQKLCEKEGVFDLTAHMLAVFLQNQYSEYRADSEAEVADIVHPTAKLHCDSNSVPSIVFANEDGETRGFVNSRPRFKLRPISKFPVV